MNRQGDKNTGKDGKKRKIALTIYVIYLLMTAVSIFLVGKLIWIQLFYNPDPKLRSELSRMVVTKTIRPMRGNIYDCEGRLLAISCPKYQISIDCAIGKKEFKSKGKVLTEEEKKEKKRCDSIENIWLAKAKQLSEGLSRCVPGKSAGEYYSLIKKGRGDKKHYLRLATDVDHNTYLKIIELPLLNEGRYKGGLIVERENDRRYPYGNLAARTIGFVRDRKSDVGNRKVGLEGKFDYVLHGTEGKEFLRKTDYGYIRDNDSVSVQAVDGEDLHTTINIDYQYIADKALHEQIDSESDLEGGCLVLMEVKTGAIRAMVNLSRDPATDDPFTERANLAIGRTGEPGSVFKTVTLMSVLSDGCVSLNTTMETNHGIVKNSKNQPDHHIVDYERTHGTNRISVIDGFKMSSNYVFAKLAIDNYKDRPMHFIDNITSYKLAEKFDFDLEGLGTPLIPSPKTLKSWSNTDLGCIGFGYTTEETPLHILTFYNAIAGKGKMMKPYLVEYIGSNGDVSSHRGPGILNASICTKAVADTLNRALKAVTSDGTAVRLKSAACTVAGKTGTSFGLFKTNGGSRYKDDLGRRLYQGTFVGYFPAEDPQYSIICVIYSKPTSKSFQGGRIPAMAVKDIVDNIYNIDPYFRNSL